MVRCDLMLDFVRKAVGCSKDHHCIHSRIRRKQLEWNLDSTSLREVSAGVTSCYGLKATSMKLQMNFFQKRPKVYNNSLLIQSRLRC